ncbi:MAG: methionine adenosyltransferase [Myxococcota bacterium]
MSKRDYLFTSESVGEGHPDKIADSISDAVLDELIGQDKNARVACETLVTTGMAVVAGEITTEGYAHIPDIVRNTIKDIGYTNADMGFDYKSCAILTSIDRQSPDIAMGVNLNGKEIGAGDQGIMFGYAINETPEFMPMPIAYAHKLMMRLAEVRKSGKYDFIRPDSKSQVSVRYVDQKPVHIDNVVIACQHSPDVKVERLREVIIEEVIKAVIPKEYIDNGVKYYINTTGRFVLGGPHADAGLTGRKIIADTYGGAAHHGGGAFSGKDPTKVDRSAAYMARHVAKNIVASGAADRCEIQLAYTIGKAEPVSVYVTTFGTGKIEDDKLSGIINEIFDFRPRAIIEYLDLLRPIYRKTACYGHFGRELPEFTWEKTDRAEEIRERVGR